MSRAPDPLSESDEVLVARIQRGETALFGILFTRHFARMERFLRVIGVPEPDLNDLLSETFSRALARIQSFKPDTGTRYVSYLYAIARNLATDRARDRARQPETVVLDEAWTEPDRHAGPVELTLHRLEVEEIRRAMERLGPSDREIILLAYDRELSSREIQAIVGKPSISAVTTHLSKALKRLRAAVLENQTPAAFR